MSGYNSLENFDRIESLEQEIIQHIRTSGIRKPRETSLIDEVLEIRKERRRLFNSLSGQISSSDNQIRVLSDELNSNRDKMNSIISERIEQITTSLKQCQAEKETMECRLKDEFKVELEKSKFHDRLKLEKIHSKYEEKNKLIESKLIEIMTEKEKADNKEAKKIAVDLLATAKTELEGRYLSKIQEYKKVLVTISDRERDLEGSLLRYKELVRTFEAENGKLKKTVQMLDNKLQHNDYRDKALELQNCELQAALKKAHEEISALREDISRSDAQHAESTAQLQVQHETKLASVDDKIRKLLDGKDRELKGLKQELQYSASKLRESERLMDSINREFVPSGGGISRSGDRNGYDKR